MPDFAQIAAAQGPAVVSISVSGTVKTRAARARRSIRRSLLRILPPLRRAGMPGGPNGGGEGGGSREIRGQGSGFIVSADGVILTNAHVGAGRAGSDRQADRPSRIPRQGPGHATSRTDMAVLKIEAKNLPTVRTGRPDQTCASGRMGAGDRLSVRFGEQRQRRRDRQRQGARSWPDETPACPSSRPTWPINPGNSGGPLFNARGEVDRHQARRSTAASGGFHQGLSFFDLAEVAIRGPARPDSRRPARCSTRAPGRDGAGSEPGLADSFKLDRPEVAGRQQSRMTARAAKAHKLRSGDVILGFKGQRIIVQRRYSAAGGPVRCAGDKVDIEVWRGGKTRNDHRHPRRCERGRAPSLGQGRRRR